MLFGLAVLGYTGISWAQSQARAVNIVCRMGDMRDFAPIEKLRPIERHVSTQLKKTTESFEPLMWLGLLGFLSGAITFTVDVFRKRKESSNIRIETDV